MRPVTFKSTRIIKASKVNVMFDNFCEAFKVLKRIIFIEDKSLIYLSPLSSYLLQINQSCWINS